LPPRDGHCACSCGGKVFIFGGVVQTGVEGQHRESNDLLMFDPGKAMTAMVLLLLCDENDRYMCCQLSCFYRETINPAAGRIAFRILLVWPKPGPAREKATD